jgi:hypothetical protein
MSDWPTKNKDLETARVFIENYALSKGESKAIGMFEITTNLEKKVFDLQLSPWVLAMTIYFQKEYGIEEGEKIARRVITTCLIQGKQIH